MLWNIWISNKRKDFCFTRVSLLFVVNGAFVVHFWIDVQILFAPLTRPLNFFSLFYIQFFVLSRNSKIMNYYRNWIVICIFHKRAFIFAVELDTKSHVYELMRSFKTNAREKERKQMKCNAYYWRIFYEIRSSSSLSSSAIWTKQGPLILNIQYFIHTKHDQFLSVWRVEHEFFVRYFSFFIEIFFIIHNRCICGGVPLFSIDNFLFLEIFIKFSVQ